MTHWSDVSHSDSQSGPDFLVGAFIQHAQVWHYSEAEGEQM